jgi:hypothetical protein
MINLTSLVPATSSIVTNVAGFNIPTYDYKKLNYSTTTNNLTSVNYKVGGSSGTTVATITYTYDSNSNITSAAKS